MTTVPDRTMFQTMYAGQAPWDIGKPQQPFIKVAACKAVRTRIDFDGSAFRSE